MTWRARLAAIRAAQGNADSAVSADSLPLGDAIGPIGAIGANDMGGEAWKADAAAVRIQAEVLAVLAAPDPELEAERALLARHYVAPPSARPYLPSDPDVVRDGLLAGALMRPPAWGDATPPPAGAWCSCCGRHNPERGGRWWSPRNPRDDGTGAGPGWRCATCHPPDHLSASDMGKIRT
jgi:hypothetical protein